MEILYEAAIGHSTQSCIQKIPSIRRFNDSLPISLS